MQIEDKILILFSSAFFRGPELIPSCLSGRATPRTP